MEVMISLTPEAPLFLGHPVECLMFSSLTKISKYLHFWTGKCLLECAMITLSLKFAKDKMFFMINCNFQVAIDEKNSTRTNTLHQYDVMPPTVNIDESCSCNCLFPHRKLLCALFSRYKDVPRFLRVKMAGNHMMFCIVPFSFHCQCF